MLYLDPERCPEVRLKSYTASVKGPKSVLKIELEISDHSELGFQLRELERIIAQQKAADASRKEAAKRRGAVKPLALPAPQKLLDFRGKN